MGADHANAAGVIFTSVEGNEGGVIADDIVWLAGVYRPSFILVEIDEAIGIQSFTNGFDCMEGACRFFEKGEKSLIE